MKAAMMILALAPLIWATASANEGETGERSPIENNHIEVRLKEPIVYPGGGHGEVVVMRAWVPPGSHSGMHTHPYRVVAYVLHGQIDVVDKNGITRHYKAGDSYLETELAHEGINNGTTPTLLLITYLGVKDAPLYTPVP